MKLMILSDRSICRRIESGELFIDPFDPKTVQPGSFDCRIGNHFLRVKSSPSNLLSLDTAIEYEEIENDSIVLPPQSFILATTMEYIRLPNDITAFVEGRSSIGRIGLFIQNAGWVDAGFEGRITLELFNANSLPIQLSAGRRVCQLVFCQMDQPAQNPYNGKYQKQDKSMGSKIYKDSDRHAVNG